MKLHNYILGTGYHTRHGGRGDALAWFGDIWWANTRKYSDPFAVYVLASGDGLLPDFCDFKGDPHVEWVNILGDLGHCGDLLKGEKPYQFAGGTACWLTLAMLAYANECDFVYKEQDLLTFGPCIETMYQEIGNRGCIFGNSRGMPCANSLMLIRHWFIPTLVSSYLQTGTENTELEMSEHKFPRLQQRNPDVFCRYSFGVDRDRPFDVTAPVWYAQKLTRRDLFEIRAAGLIDFEGTPPDTSEFSNCA